MSTVTGPSGVVPDDRLKGRMGVLDVMFTVIAYNAPAVVFLGTISVAILIGNGVGTPVIFLFVGLILAVLGSGLINLSSTMKRPGGFYAMVSTGLGKPIGLAVGFAALLTYFCGVLVASTIGPVTLTGFLSTEFGLPLIPWWVVALIAVGAVGVLGYLNIQFSARVLYFFLGLEFLLMVAYVVSVFLQGGPEGLGTDSFLPQNVFSGSIATGILFAILCFGGFEATVIFREEVKDPNRTIKRATYATVAVIAISYATLAYAFITAFGPQAVLAVLEEDFAGAAATSVREYLGDWGFIFANLLLVTSAFALGLAAHNVLTRYVYNFGKDGILPAAMGATHPRHDSPYRASVMISVISIIGVVGMALTPIEPTTLYATVSGFLSYTMVIMLVAVCFAAGTYMLRRRSSTTLHAVVMYVVGLLLAAVLAFASAQFSLLSGLTGAAGIVGMTFCWVFIIGGAVVALVLRRTRPDVYARLGREEALLDDGEVSRRAADDVVRVES